MEGAGLDGGATFLSLDVEGAEAVVLGTVDASKFALVLVEADGHDAAKDAAVRRLLERAGHRRQTRPPLGRIGPNDV